MDKIVYISGIYRSEADGSLASTNEYQAGRSVVQSVYPVVYHCPAQEMAKIRLNVKGRGNIYAN